MSKLRYVNDKVAALLDGIFFDSLDFLFLFFFFLIVIDIVCTVFVMWSRWIGFREIVRTIEKIC